MFFLMLILLLSFSSSVYRSSNPKLVYGGTYSSFQPAPGTFDPSMCKEAQDFILQIDPAGCNPPIVRSDLLEEQHVVVFCPIKAVKINPLIDVETIRNIKIRGEVSRDVQGVSFYPAHSALSMFRDDSFVDNPVPTNIGYATIRLRTNPNESSMPEYVQGNLTATLRYDIESAFGIGKSQFYLPVMDDDEWGKNMNQYSFWDKRGFLRAENVNEDSVTIAIYSNVYRTPFEGKVGEKRKFSTIKLGKGETSEMMSLPGFYCLAGIEFKLESVSYADTTAVLKVNSEYFEVREGETFLDDRCELRDIGKLGINQNVEIYCREDDQTFFSGRGSNNLEFAPKVKIKIDDKIENVAIGDYLYTSEDGIKKVYLGYVDTSGNSFKEKDLEACLIAIPITHSDYKDKEKLDEDLILEVKKMAEGLRIKSMDEEKTMVALAKAALKFYFQLGKFGWDNLVDGENYEFLFYGKEKDFHDKKVSLLGFSGGEDFELNKETSKYYEASYESFDEIITNYPNEKYPDVQDENLLSEEALVEKIILAEALNQTFALNQLCEEFKNIYSEDSCGSEFQEAYPKYPQSGVCDTCYDKAKLASFGGSIISVMINGNVKDISLEKVYEPNYNDYGVDLIVRYPDNSIEEFFLKKNQIIYLDDSKKHFVMLKEIKDEETVVIQISTNKTGFQTAEDYLIGNSRIFTKDIPRSFDDDYIFTVEDINLKRFAKVKLIPNVHRAESTAEFSFKIFIEKRGIQLAPDQIKDKIEKLNKTIKQWESISENLGTFVKGMKAACLGTSAVLTVKNLIENSGGKSIARTEVMRGERGWHEKCAELVEQGHSTSQESCFLNNSKKIEEEVDLIYKEMREQNEEIKKFQDENMGEGSVLGEKFVNTNKFVKDYSNYTKIKITEDSITNPRNSKEFVNLTKFKETFDENSFKEGNYNIDQLKEIDLYYSLWKNAEDLELKEKYGQRLYNVLSDVEKNSESFVLMQNFANKTGLKNSIIDFKGLDKIPITEDESFKKSKYYEKNKGILNENDYVISYQKQDKEYLIKYTPDGKIDSTYLVDGFGKLEKTDEPNPNEIYIKKYDGFTYKNKYKNPELKYYETEPYKGRPAIVPFDTENGWYAYIKQTLPVGGDIGSYDLSGKVESFFLCNVGANGREDFNSDYGDDICQLMNLGTGQPYNQFHDLEVGEAENLVRKAVNAIAKASRKKVRTGRIEINGNWVDIGSPASNLPLVECSDFMSAKNCQLLFNVCDPVICPPSRCDFGGKYPVQDVIQSGIIGSIALCLPNFNEGVYIPICLTGVKAGIDGWLSVTKSYKDCLDHNLKTGKTIGICDEVHSIYMCEFFWRQALPIAKLAIPKLLKIVAGQTTRGGGEYMGVEAAWENAQNSIEYFTNYYALNSFKAFQFRSAEQVGTEVCKNFISLSYPGGADILDTITEPDSPPQFTGRFDEIPFTTVTNPPISHYKVFYHIYAGNDRGAYFRVYLREGSQTSYYQDTGFVGGLGRIVDSGYIPKAGYASETIDFTAPSGFKELCINVNGQEECGFGQVSTNFAVDYIKDQYINQQSTQTDIKTEKQCISGTASLYSLLNPNVQEGAGDLIDPQIYNKGIIRICATDNPGSSSDPYYGQKNQRWIQVGYCGDQKMKCWVDTNSLGDAFEFSYNEEQALKELGDIFVNQTLYAESSTYFKNDAEFKVAVQKIKDEDSSEEKIKFIEKIFANAFFNHQKAYLYFLRGLAYGDLSKLSYGDYLAKKEEDKKEIPGDLCEYIEELGDFFIAQDFDNDVISKMSKKLSSRAVDVQDLSDGEIVSRYFGKFCTVFELGYVSPGFEFRDGRSFLSASNPVLCFKYFNSKWNYWKGSCSVAHVVDRSFRYDIPETTASKKAWVPVDDFQNAIFSSLSNSKQEFIKGLEKKKSYAEGLRFLINRVFEDDEGGLWNNWGISKGPRLITESGNIEIDSERRVTITQEEDQTYFLHNKKDNLWYWWDTFKGETFIEKAPEFIPDYFAKDPFEGHDLPLNVKNIVLSLNTNYNGDLYDGIFFMIEYLEEEREIEDVLPEIGEFIPVDVEELREKIIEHAKDRVGKKCGKDCWTSVLSIYKDLDLKLGSTLKCVFSERYSPQSERSQPPCSDCGCEKDEDGNCVDCSRDRYGLKKGDLVQVYNANTVSTTGGHNFIFESWVDETSFSAWVFDQNYKTKLLQRRIYELHPGSIPFVTVIWEPRGSGTSSATTTSFGGGDGGETSSTTSSFYSTKYDLLSAINYLKDNIDLDKTYSDLPEIEKFVDDICNEELLSDKQCVDIKGEGILFGWFNRENNMEDVWKMLITKRSEVRNEFLGLVNRHEWEDWGKILNLILKENSLVNSGDEDYTSLLYAVQYKDLETVKFLVEKGADIYLTKSKGNVFAYAELHMNILERDKIIEYLKSEDKKDN